MNDTDTTSDLRRERERVTVLVNAAREFMLAVSDYVALADAPDLNREMWVSWHDLKEVCDTARPTDK